MLRHRAVDGVDPFAFTDRAGQELALGPKGLERELSGFLARDLTRWGDMVFAGARSGGSMLVLDFAGEAHRVSFCLRPAQPEGPTTSVRLGPIEVGLLHDTRPAGRGFDRAVESYLIYALQRALATASRFAVVEEAVTPRSPGKDDGFVPRESLFRAGGTFSGCRDVLASCLGAADGATSVVMHAAGECNRHFRFITAANPPRTSMRLEPLPVAAGSGHARLVDTQEMDAITGSDTRFRQALRRSVQGASPRLLIVGETCMADCIGLDLESIAAEEVGPDVQIAMVRVAIDESTPMSRFWATIFQVAKPKVPVDPGRVNLVGFGPERSAFLDETRTLLHAAGLHVGGAFIPSFRTDAAETFLSAECTVLNSSALTRTEFCEVQAKLWSMRYVEVAPPFGPAATRKFFEHVCTAAGRSFPVAAAEAQWEPCRPAWEAFRVRAQEHEVAIVVGADDADKLLDPRRLHGIDLVGTLMEMGFSVRVVLRARDGLCAKVERRLAALLPGPGRVVTDGAFDDEPLRDILARVPSTMVFSGYSSDSRVWNAGKVPIQASHFEMGYRGALRTLARLVRLAEYGARARSEARIS